VRVKEEFHPSIKVATTNATHDCDLQPSKATMVLDCVSHQPQLYCEWLTIKEDIYVNCQLLFSR